MCIIKLIYIIDLLCVIAIEKFKINTKDFLYELKKCKINLNEFTLLLQRT